MQYEQGDMETGEVVRAIKILNCEKAPDIDGTTGELLKYGGKSANDYMHLICNVSAGSGRRESFLRL